MTATLPRNPRRLRFVLLLLFTTLLIGVLSQRKSLLAWHYVSRLETASAVERNQLTESLIDLGEAATPSLRATLRRESSEGTIAAGQAFSAILLKLPQESRDEQLRKMTSDFASFSVGGKSVALDMFHEILKIDPAGCADLFRPVVAEALKSMIVEHRQKAVPLAAMPEINLPEGIVPLLSDSSSTVRRAALLILGPLRENTDANPLVATEDLIRLLHDPDEEIRSLCETSLRSRGLREQDIRTSRQFSHPDPLERLKLLLELNPDDGINAASLLDRLCNDSISAVRAGAVRVAAENGVEIHEKLEQMSRDDPSEAVRQMVKEYRKFYPGPR